MSVSEHGVADIFSALGDRTRLEIVARLVRGEVTISDLASPLEMSLTAVSKHVAVLQRAGLVGVEKRGRTRYCRLQAAPFREAASWLNECEQFWSQNLDRLAMHLDRSQNEA